ncbi:MAG: hypothetical protein A4E67_00972 [Syntrophaceae bacterium PtaB.Bin038]|nr:MAG: hypothetical protein A4E67_00972 [Syntrophaceae bacterium PtaB.Bin038]
MRGLFCGFLAGLVLAGSLLFAMEPAGPGQEEPEGTQAALAFKPGSEPATGLEGIEWGSAVGGYEGLVPRECNVFGFEELCRYRAEGTGDGLEEVDVDLLFWRGRLFGGELTVKGRKNWAPFRRMVSDEFGGPASPAAGDEYTWEGEKALAHLYYSSRSRRASLIVVSVEIGNEMGRAAGLEMR